MTSVTLRERELTGENFLSLWYIAAIATLRTPDLHLRCYEFELALVPMHPMFSILCGGAST